MKHLWSILLWFTAVAPMAPVNAASLELTFRHTLNGEPLTLDGPPIPSAAREPFTISRVSYLLADAGLERPDGTWLELSNSVAWIDAQAGRTSWLLENIPPGTYRSVRFHLGPAPAVNNGPTTNFPPNHPLNPNLNGLHWSWQGGYIFMTVEGLWGKMGAPDGFSFHLARDPNRTRIQLPLALDLAQNLRAAVDFDLGTLLNAPRAISFARDGTSTHSRPGDAIASALVANLPGSFRVRQVAARQPSKVTGPAIQPLYLPAHFTPYRFEMSAVFPIPDLPRDNPLIEERVALGRRLFHDPLLSRNATISCASCHDQRAAFTDPQRFSIGVSNRLGTRNGMPLFNLAWRQSFFWDGRAPSLRAQALMPIQDHAEMDESLTNVVAKLSRTNYAADFARAYGSPEISAEKLGLALEQFLLTLTSFDSKFDQALRGEAEFTEQEKRGFELFMTEFDPRREQFGADCFHCHGGPLFQSQTFANNGLDRTFADRGRGAITGRTADDGKFATPSLRNIALTAPYMHDGRFNTLEEVVEHYSSGMKRNPTLDPNLAKHPDGGLHLNAEDKQALVAFLKTLTDPKYTSPSEQPRRK